MGYPSTLFHFIVPLAVVVSQDSEPVTAKGIEPASTIVQRVDVLFIDRVSKSSMLLAEAASKAGVIIVFEPVSLHESKAFTHLLDLANIVKYSHDRIDELPPSASQSRQLEIQTFGRGGLRFKLSGDRRWRHMQAEPVERLVDAAGSGDWLTAGFLYGFYRGRARSQKTLEQEHVILALTLGQKLAAWNCGFRARGGMYSDARSRIAHIIAETLSRSAVHLDPALEVSDEPSAAREVCLNCADSRVGSVHSSSALGTMAIRGGHR